MKYVLAILLVFSALPAPQAAGCAVEAGQHGAMLQHAPDLSVTMAKDNKSDCCEPNDDGVEHDCDQAAHCAPCLTIALGIATNPASGDLVASRHFEAIAGDAYKAPPLHPPFRPPIS